MGIGVGQVLMSSKIDQLAELKIERESEAPTSRRGWLIGVFVAIVLVVGTFSWRVLTNLATAVEVHTVRLASSDGRSSSVLDAT